MAKAKKEFPLSEDETAAVIMALANYEDTAQAEEDGVRERIINGLRARLKRFANEKFKSNWAV